MNSHELVILRAFLNECIMGGTVQCIPWVLGFQWHQSSSPLNQSLAPCHVQIAASFSIHRHTAFLLHPCLPALPASQSHLISLPPTMTPRDFEVSALEWSAQAYVTHVPGNSVLNSHVTGRVLPLCCLV